jgi:hypothetical protein
MQRSRDAKPRPLSLSLSLSRGENIENRLFCNDKWENLSGKFGFGL